MSISNLNAQEFLRDALAGMQGLGPWGYAVFVMLYILATVLFLPGSVLTLGAGFVFGVILGSVLASVASTLGATAAFLVGRHLVRGWVSRQIEGNAKFRAIDEAVAREGWIGMMPGTFMYVYIGSLAGDLATLGGGPRARTPAEWALYVFGLAATVAVTIYVTRLARGALQKRIDS